VGAAVVEVIARLVSLHELLLVRLSLTDVFSVSVAVATASSLPPPPFSLV
jgi:hypothetical protein